MMPRDARNVTADSQIDLIQTRRKLVQTTCCFRLRQNVHVNVWGNVSL